MVAYSVTTVIFATLCKLRKRETLKFNTIINFVDIIHHPDFYLKQLFGDWTLPLSSDKSVWPNRLSQSHFPDTKSNIREEI
jgi:hypothetical protein